MEERKRHPIKQKIIDLTEQLSSVLLTKKMIKIIRKIAVSLALIFFIGFIVVKYLHDNQLLIFKWPENIPNNYFFSIYIAFTFILFYEVLSIIFVIPQSIANSIGKQFEIMSLIILRSVLEKVGNFVHFTHHKSFLDFTNKDWQGLEALLVGSLGSVLIFLLVSMYYKLQKHRKICADPTELEGFTAIKKIVSLGLITLILFLAVYELIGFTNALFTNKDIEINHIFFERMFTLLIFVDILLVLITMRYTASYPIVFRTSGLMISTVILRMSFTHYMSLSVLLTIVAVLVGIGITYIYNRFETDEDC